MGGRALRLKRQAGSTVRPLTLTEPTLHLTRGRVTRFRARPVPELRGREDVALEVQRALAACPGVVDVRVRAGTGSVAVWFREDVLDVDGLCAMLRSAGLLSIHPQLRRDDAARGPLDEACDGFVSVAAAAAVRSLLHPAALGGASLALTALRGAPTLHVTKSRIRARLNAASRHNAEALAQHVQQVQGVLSAQVRPETGSVVVHSIPGAVTPEQLLHALRAGGWMAPDEVLRREWSLSQVTVRGLRALGSRGSSLAEAALGRGAVAAFEILFVDRSPRAIGQQLARLIF